MSAILQGWWATWRGRGPSKSGLLEELRGIARADGTRKTSRALREWLATYAQEHEEAVGESRDSLTPEEAKGWAQIMELEGRQTRRQRMRARDRGPGVRAPAVAEA